MTEKNVAYWTDRWIRALVVSVLAALVWLAVPQAARADWSIVGETVPADQVIDNDVLAQGTDVLIDGAINGDLLAVGSTVTINGPVSGSLVAVGSRVTVNGEVEGSVYAASETLELGPSADVIRNVHYVGLLLDSHSGSRIGRDLVVASLRGRVSSEIGRTLNAAILLLTFQGRIGGIVDVPEEGATLPARIESGGSMLFVGSSASRAIGLAAPSLEVRYPQQNEEDVAGIPAWLVARLGDLGALLVVGGLVMWLRPALIQRPAEGLLHRPLSAAGFGLLALTLAVNAAAIAMLLAVLLLVVGIWLGGVVLWTPAFLLWGIGYPALTLAFSSFVLIILYGSKVVVADMVGTLILQRAAPQVLDAKRRFLPLLLGLILYVILRSIPLLGWAISVIVTAFGLGAIWVALRDQRSLLPPVVVEADWEREAEQSEEPGIQEQQGVRAQV
jgi:cytoskeletal protein CcmA (bactofilin family)